MKMNYDIILRPVITERSMDNIDGMIYSFEVDKNANKIEIKKAVEELFDVKVKSVNTMNVKGKKKRMGRHQGYRASRKKAVIRLRQDSKSIEFFEGMV
ncbi:MAG: 50S ribosomal protein L23 [Oscillospiraceae bacterium]|nr:50S ribosomal protein L23 [Oscillospiraceae bacterium]